MKPDKEVDDDLPCDLAREVYSILGMPIDVIEMPSALYRVKAAAASRMPFLVSTPNLNFLANFRSEPEFRESILQSDLCLPDGTSIVWLARLLGVPIRNRVAGSDLFDALKAGLNPSIPLKVFLFGGLEGVAVAACRKLNDQNVGVYCVGSYYPGSGSTEDMSGDEIINRINHSNADFLVVALGARKGQIWLLQNHHRLLIPVRSHLGAVINFQAGVVRRSPSVLRRIHLEWLWRIKEEPHLWERYWNDGKALLRLLFTSILPLAVWERWLRLKYGGPAQDLIITPATAQEVVTLSLSGPATAQHLPNAIPVFKRAIAANRPIVIDFTNANAVDARFLGFLLMFRKQVKKAGAKVTLTGLSPRLKTLFRLHGSEFLLSAGNDA